jgi:O-antigen/teichoic acid export membrane protein
MNAQAPDRSTHSRGFAAAAASGSAWTTVQTVVNKAVTVVAMLLLARILDPEDYGRANIATSVGAFISVISPFILGDVLLSMPGRFRSLAGTALWVGAGSAAALFAAMLFAAPLVEGTTGKAGVAACVMLVAFRPICDAVLVIPFTKLRIDLAYRTLAVIDLVVILLATAASVLMAWIGMGAASLIVPPIATLAVRGAAYWYCTAGQIPLRASPPEIKPLVRRFCAASIGQYLNNVLQILEMLVLGFFATEAGAGFFGFAFQLAIQANAVVAVQFGTVLQPIFGLLKAEPARQSAAFMRAIRLLAAIAIPVSAFQAALALPAFRMLFGTKWDGAVAIFVALSIGQGFVFVAAPATALIKAQGRFRAYVIWQGVHLVVALAGFIVAARFGAGAALRAASALGLEAPPEAGVPLAVASASTVAWAVSTPVGMWVCGRPAGLRRREVLAVFVRPWCAAAVAGSMALGGWVALEAVLAPVAASIIGLFVLAPVLMASAVWASAGGSSETRADLVSIARRLAGRASRRG